MASSSDGVGAVNMAGLSSYTFSSAGDMKSHLQSLLDSKEKQLQQAGTLGQRVLAQQMELEERIRQLQEVDADKSEDEEIDSEARERYRELAETIIAWDAENAQLSGAFGSKRLVNGRQPSPEMPATDLPREEPERSKASTSAAQSRRAKNAAHRADDVEFAFEIGSGLLTEVRRLQSLLGERDKAIQDMKEEKDDLEKTVETLRAALRTQEQSSDKYKEENWNLEVTLQELRTQLSDSQASVLRFEGEHKRLSKLLSSSRESADNHKNESERLKNSLDELKAKHETDVAQARKHAAGLQRDKSDLQSSLDTMKAEVARANRRLPRFGSPLTPDARGAKDFLTPEDIDEDVFSVAGTGTQNRKKIDNSAIFASDDFEDLSPEPSPSRPFLGSNHPSSEIEALQQRLSHAQRQINTLRGTLQREKEMRMEYKRKWESSPGSPHEEEEVEAFEDETEVVEKPRQRLTPFRSAGRTRGRGRGRGGLTLVQRLGMAAHSPASEYNDDEDLVDPDTPPPPVPPIPIRFQDVDADDHKESQDEEERDVEPRSPSLDVRSNRTSVDGMDPAFANILRRSSSSGSIPHNSSPLRQSIVARPTRGGAPRRSRGGAAYQEARPPSLVGQPEALAAELGLGAASVVENEIHHESPRETVDFGCQTDFEETTVVLPPPVDVPVLPETSEMAVQADPEPVPEPASSVVTSEISCQTEEEPAVQRLERAIQHDAPVVPRPIVVSMSVNTDPEEIPPLAQAEVQTLPLSTMDADTQTLPSPVAAKFDMNTQTPPSPIMARFDADTQTPKSPLRSEADIQTDDMPVGLVRRSTITQHDLSGGSIGSSSGDTTITRATGRALLLDRAFEVQDEDEETEIETETEDYHDASQSIGVTPSSQSLDDFHSVLTMTDNELSESDDDDIVSIKASRMPSRQGVAPDSEPTLPMVSPVTYESKSISAEIIDTPEPKLESKLEPKPELKEISIQTDEWVPPPATPAVVPAASPGFGLYRVGSTGQQFQFVSPPPSAGPTTPAMPVGAPLPVSAIRDSAGSFNIRPRTPRASQTDRRQSIESVVSSVMEEGPSRSRVPSSTPSAADKTRPPMMILPPPPRQPPPTSSMPPPSFIPERRIPTTSTGSYDVPPPRPSSPPPAELIQRATTPTFGSALSVPGRGPRQHGSSMPPSQQGLWQPPSTSSFRSAANAAAAYAHHPVSGSTPLSSFSVREMERREMSTTSLVSDRSVASPRSSLSSDHLFANRSAAQGLLPSAPVTPNNKLASNRTAASGGSTDPAIIHAITQTMIGEFLYKYTRRTIGKGYGQTRHKRFFWVHPYTKTLYWSSADPGSSNVSESSAKSAYIEGVRSVLDPNPMPPGLYQYSVVVSTPQREMKITAPSKERHDIWLNALKYLLSRPTGMSVNSPANGAIATLSPMPRHAELLDEHDPMTSSPQSQRSSRSARKGDSWNTTPRGQRSRSQLSVGGSIGKRSGTPAAEYLRWNGPDSPYSPSKSFEHIPGQDDEDLDFELHDDTMSDEGFEGLENVRACCDGRHTVGHSGKNHRHHHHHHHHPHIHNGGHLDVNPADVARPASPAWSFRSLAGSSNSHEGGNGMFTWGRGEGGKLRFGSRRSNKTVPGVAHDQ